jgi:hypothetical protein
VEEAGRNYDLLLTLGQTDMSYNLFIKMGWRLLGHLPFYIKVWDAGPLVGEKIKNRFVAGILSSAANILLGVYGFFKKPRRSDDIDIGMIGSFGEEADSFWSSLSACHEVVVARDKKYLSWKYDAHPDMQHIRLRASRAGKVSGYIVLRCLQRPGAKKEGLVVDIIVGPGDDKAILALLAGAFDYFRQQGCYAARCFINRKEIEKALRACGFLRRRPYMRFLVDRKIEGLDKLDDFANWYITAGDCDIDR